MALTYYTVKDEMIINRSFNIFSAAQSFVLLPRLCGDRRFGGSIVLVWIWSPASRGSGHCNHVAVSALAL